MSKVQIRQRGGQNPRLTSAETGTVWPSCLSHSDQRDQPSHGYIYRPNDRMDWYNKTNSNVNSNSGLRTRVRILGKMNFKN